MSATRHRLFVSVTPGLEPYLQRELVTLGIERSHALEGGVELVGDRERLWRVCRRSALAEGLRVRVGRPFVARSFPRLAEGIARLALHAFVARGGPLPRVKVVAHRSRLYHSDAIAERVLNVLRGRLGCRDDEASEQLLHVRLEDDRVQVSVDAAGEPLHRRGYREHVGAAPLRETLAAALLCVGGYEPNRPLWDPFCGAGTIAIEAARAAAGLPAGSLRRFAFERWPVHDPEGYARFVERDGETPASTRPSIIGSDRDEGALRAARANADRAGVERGVTWILGDLDRAVAHIPQGVVVVSNPPYGKRLSRRELGRTFDALGAILRRRRDIERVLMMDGSGAIDELTRFTWRVRARISNRGIPVRLMELLR